MIGLLVGLLVLCLVLWLVWVILGMLPLPAPVKQVAIIVFAIIAILLLVGYVPMGSLGLRGRR